MKLLGFGLRGKADAQSTKVKIRLDFCSRWWLLVTARSVIYRVSGVWMYDRGDGGLRIREELGFSE